MSLATDRITQTIQWHGLAVDVLRLDLIHPVAGGNKWFKLKYNIEAAERNGAKGIVTFGGANSNHLAAAAWLCQERKMNCVALVRGETDDTPTLKFGRSAGMQVVHLTREDYKKKAIPSGFENFWVVPEGGANIEGVRGCIEIPEGLPPYDQLLCACGTAGTFAGLVAAETGAVVTGISVLKGDNHLPQRASELISAATGKGIDVGHGDNLLSEHNISNAWCFNGYAGFDRRLTDFKTSFELQHGIPLDHVYTVKLFYAVNELISDDRIKKSDKVLVVHTGGLQGNAAFEKRYLGLR